MIEYLLKVAICSLLFFGLYKLLLEREHMYRFNRIYLLGSLLFSFLVPLVTFTVVKEMPVMPVMTITPEIIFDEFIPMEAPLPVSEPFDWSALLVWIYGVGTAVVLLRFLWNMGAIALRIRRSEIVRDGKAVIVLVEGNIIPHTFLKYIFINRDDYRSSRIEHEILLHEWVHVAQRHSLDKILVELLIVLMWFNPVIYLYKRSIYLNHEFLADEGVLSRFDDLASYQNLLIHRFSGAGRYPVASPFSFLTTKKRLIMMTKKTSRGRSLTKALATLPLLAVAVFMFSGRTVVYAEGSAGYGWTEPAAGIADFSLLVEEAAGNKTKITALEGCAFKQMEFSLKEGQARQIHSSGVVGPEDEAEGIDRESFRFLIKKTKDEYELQAIKGTKWLRLGFGSSVGSVALVNASGVATGPDIKDKFKDVIAVESSALSGPEYTKLVQDAMLDWVRTGVPTGEDMNALIARANTGREMKFDEFTEDKSPEIEFFQSSEEVKNTGHKITGVVGDDLGPLMRVNVYLVDSRGVARKGVMTDMNGTYVLDIGTLPKYPEDKAYTIVFSLPGYGTKEFPYDGQTKLNVILVPTPEALAKGEALTAKMKANAMADKKLGADGPPLVVIDGTPQYSLKFDRNFDFTNADVQDYCSVLKLDGANIENIEVVKDKAATTAWGPTAANGVLIVTMKKDEVKGLGESGQKATRKIRISEDGNEVEEIDDKGNVIGKIPNGNITPQIVVSSEIIGTSRPIRLRAFINDEEVDPKRLGDLAYKEFKSSDEVKDKLGLGDMPGGVLQTRMDIMDDGTKVDQINFMTREYHDAKMIREGVKEPVFKNEGLGEFMGWVEQNVKYPAEAKKNNLQGEVSIRFTVDEKGKVKDVSCTDPFPNEILAREAIRVVKSSPKWKTPGTKGGKNAPWTYGFGVDVKPKDVMVEITPAVFQKGGFNEFREWVCKNVTYPEEAMRKGVQGRVVAEVFLEKDGNIGDIRIVSTPDQSLSEEVIKVVKSCPQWVSPTMEGDKRLRTGMVLPVNFRIKEFK